MATNIKYSVRLLSLLIRVVHFGILGFILLGSMSSNKLVLTLHLLVIPIVILHWKTNDGRCILSEWDLKLKSSVSSGTEVRGHFIRSIFSSIGMSPSDQQLKKIIYAVFAASWISSCFRLLMTV
jgi:hypothetical protein